MAWLENVRKKSREEKIKLIWQITAIAAVVLIILWILVGRYNDSTKKNTDLFKTIGTGIKSFKLDNPNTNNQ
ncbi:MAG: hypothetical protein JWO40_166 [Candidatus Doudnabacteria bacterium]|nr:hypothetical protein [Candidatus Doudnabacteria bacterium]